MADTQVDAHLREDDEHWVPTRTTPQGSQALGVEGGYEERDINLPVIVRWIVGLAVVTALVHLLAWGGFHLLLQREQRTDTGPEIFRSQRAPDLPRLLPNRVDYPERPTAPVPMPPEVLRAEQAREDGELVKHHLLDPETGLAALPEGAARAVMTGGGTAPDPGAPGTGGLRAPRDAAPPPSAAPRAGLGGFAHPMPSDSSGGTRTENRLR